MSLEQTNGTGTGTTQASTPIAELHRISAEQQRRTDNAILREALAMSSETCNALIEKQNSLLEKLTEREQSSLESLGKELTERTEESMAVLGERVSEVTLAYRKIMEKETDEVRKAVSTLTKALEEEPVAKKEIAETLRTSIEVAAEGLTSYYKLQLADSLSDLDGTLKKTKEKMEDLGGRAIRGKKFSRVIAFVTPALLVATLCVSVAGFFV